MWVRCRSPDWVVSCRILITRAASWGGESTLGAALSILGHRGFLHSAAFWALLTGVFWLLNGFADFLPAETWKLLSIGHASHLAGDMLVGGNGVQLLWPMKQRQTIVPGTWSLGGLHEIVLFCIFSLITAYLFGYTWG